jgi:hypothetical protein
LLLNCYAKLKDIEKLEKFIKSPGDLKFDLDTAISMCRQGGYYEQAAYLATKHGENELVVDITIEDLKRYEEALDYICRLEPEAVCIRYAANGFPANIGIDLSNFNEICKSTFRELL